MTNDRKKILVVDDEADMLTLLKKRLESHGLECLTALDPVEGLKIAAKEKPGLIVLDLMLPKMSGFGFLRIIRQNPFLSSIPVVVMTALGDQEIAREAMDLGAVAYLTKSCEPEELIKTIREYAS